MAGRNFEEALFAFGVIADLHYVDCENSTNFEKTCVRSYRRSLELLKRAVEDWKQLRISFVVDLGDVIDGKNVGLKKNENALGRVLEVYDQCMVPVYHVWGNHEMYNFSRKWLNESKIMNPRYITGNTLEDPCSYTHFSPFEHLRIIILDSYDVSILGHADVSPTYEAAEKVLQINPNDNKNSPIGLRGKHSRFVKFNGALSKRQLDWLDGLLESSDQCEETVLVFGHTALETLQFICLCWNYDEVLNILHKHNCVVAYLCGHVHQFEHSQDSHGIHHITLPGIVEVPVEVQSGHSTIEVYRDKILVCGNDVMPTIVIPLPRVKH